MIIDNNSPVYPIKLYIYNEDGTYSEPILILSEEHLHGVGVKFVVQNAVSEGREVMMTDPMDLCLFHAKDKKILFPEPETS